MRRREKEEEQEEKEQEDLDSDKYNKKDALSPQTPACRMFWMFGDT